MSKVKIALVGAGNIANAHLESYKRVADAEIYAICDINEERLNETADKFGIERRYTDLDTMLKELPELDAADVCVWNCNHAECTIKALEAGLNVLCEKPMAYNVEQAEKMLEASKKAGKLLMIGFVMRFSDKARIATDFIKKGYLGDVYFAKAHYIRRHGNPGGWFADIEKSGGGPVIDLGVHVIDHTRQLMGNPKPVSVYAVSYNNIGKRDNLRTNPGWMPKGATLEDPVSVEDFATAIIRYDNGASTLLETSYNIHDKSETFCRIYGTKAGMDLTDGVKIFTEYNDFLADINVKINNYVDAKDQFDAEMEHFVDCVKNGTECIAKAEDGVVIMKILDGIYRSAKTGHEVII